MATGRRAVSGDQRRNRWLWYPPVALAVVAAVPGAIAKLNGEPYAQPWVTLFLIAWAWMMGVLIWSWWSERP
jgi:hypothetical protein